MVGVSDLRGDLRAGKTYGTNGNKIGNGHLKWAFSEKPLYFIYVEMTKLGAT
ncbi:hypothetical protein PFLA_a0087 [Pseudoalteromonas flavipulchra NCIMB 2033 = ATCC BAA-314]|nr:hypothetical protein [Pseudoalteromonas flavipulchra NCIMB 2033 = ATCC BAA-314]